MFPTAAVEIQAVVDERRTVLSLLLFLRFWLGSSLSGLSAGHRRILHAVSIETASFWLAFLAEFLVHSFATLSNWRSWPGSSLFRSQGWNPAKNSRPERWQRRNQPGSRSVQQEAPA